MSEDIQYRIISVLQIFDTNNSTLIRDYCTIHPTISYKKIVLVVVIVDNFSEEIVPTVSKYLECYDSIINTVLVLMMDISSPDKALTAVIAVVETSVEMGLSGCDVVVVIGGRRTLMDIVSCAASVLHGGIPYVRIQTTLLGMIDVGVGVKVGVSFRGSKNVTG
jgi:3-dehydroquinate synthetase